MTVPSTTYRTDYAGTAGTLVFPYTFRTLASNEIVVTAQYTTGEPVVLTNYTVDGVGALGGGNITFATAPFDDATLVSLTFTRDPADTQTLDIRNQTAIPRAALEDALDRRTMVSLKQQEEIDRSIKFPVSDTGVTVTLPPASQRALKTLAFDADGNAIAGEAPTGGIVSVAMTPVVQASTLALGRAAMGPWQDISALGCVTVLDPVYGAVGDGLTDDTAAIQAALTTGKDVVIPRGYTFLVDGNLSNGANGQRIFGGGCIKKKSGNVKPIFYLADASENVHFDGIEIDGSLSSFTIGNATPAIFGYLVKSVKVTNCYLHDNADAGIKLRDSAGLFASGNYFYRTQNNGIELRNYINDPRTGVPYVGTRPTVQGNIRIIGNRFERTDDGGHGAGDGCGVTFDSVNGSYPFKNVVVEGNTFQDCLRCIWSENNISGSEAINVSIIGNTLLGNVLGAGTSECKDGIGLIGVRGAVIKGNTLRNISNIVSVGTPAGIQISGSLGVSVAEDIDIEGNVVVDDTGAANRMDNAILITLADRVRIAGNRVGGASVAQVSISASNVTNLECYDNPGAEGEYSWSGCTMTQVFWKDNLAAASTLNLSPAGWTGDHEIVMPCSGTLVAMAVRLSAGISAGTIIVTPYTNSVARTNLQIVNADFGGGAIATKLIDQKNGVVVTAGQRIKVEAVTDGSWSPTTNDIHVTLVFDLGRKR